MKTIMENWQTFLNEVKWKPSGATGMETSPEKRALGKLFPEIYALGTQQANQIFEVLLNPEKKPMFFDPIKANDIRAGILSNPRFRQELMDRGLDMVISKHYKKGELAILIGKPYNVRKAKRLVRNANFGMENYQHMDKTFLKNYLSRSKVTPEWHLQMGKLLGYGDDADMYYKIEKETLNNLSKMNMTGNDWADTDLYVGFRDRAYTQAQADLDIERVDLSPDDPLKKRIESQRNPERIAGKPTAPPKSPTTEIPQKFTAKYGEFAEKLFRGAKTGLKTVAPFAAAALTALDAEEAWAGYKNAKTPEERNHAIISPIARAMGYDVYEMIRDLPDATQYWEEALGESPWRKTQTARAKHYQQQQDTERAKREEFKADVKSGQIKNPAPIIPKPPF